jgi:hypothetical protein
VEALFSCKIVRNSFVGRESRSLLLRCSAIVQGSCDSRFRAPVNGGRIETLRIHDKGRGREICAFIGFIYLCLEARLRLRHQHTKTKKARVASKERTTAAAIRPFL